NLKIPISGGPRGTYALFREQLLRVARCSWTFQFDAENQTVLKDVFLAEGLAFFHGDKKDSQRGHILLDNSFFNHLIEHAVPLNTSAIMQLRHESLALSLYVWAPYRLHRVESEAAVTWDHPCHHFGIDYSESRFMGRGRKPLLLMVL